MSTMTPNHNVTDDQLRQLRAEALSHGDDRQVELCDDALAGDSESRAACAEAIAEASAAACGTDDCLTARRLTDGWIVEDEHGGVWTATEAATAEIDASDDPVAAAVHMAIERPCSAEYGEWSS